MRIVHAPDSLGQLFVRFLNIVACTLAVKSQWSECSQRSFGRERTAFIEDVSTVAQLADQGAEEILGDDKRTLGGNLLRLVLLQRGEHGARWFRRWREIEARRAR